MKNQAFHTLVHSLRVVNDRVGVGWGVRFNEDRIDLFRRFAHQKMYLQQWNLNPLPITYTSHPNPSKIDNIRVHHTLYSRQTASRQGHL